MQKEFARHFPSLSIQIVGINEKGQESGNANVTNGRQLPWLQDVDVNPQNNISDVWYDSWKIEYRDVVVVDRAGNEAGRYNLTSHSLGVEENYNVMRQMFLDSAKNPQQTPWQCPVEPLDVTLDNRVELNDVLQIINAVQLGTYPGGKLPNLNGATPISYYDVTGDMNITLQDAIAIINHLALVFQPTSALSATVSGDGGSSSLPGGDTGIDVNPATTVAPTMGGQVQGLLNQASSVTSPQLQANATLVNPPLVLPSLGEQRLSAVAPGLTAKSATDEPLAKERMGDERTDQAKSSHERMVDALFAQGW